MNRYYLLSLSLLSSLVLFTSCDKDEDEKVTTETMDAELVWSGDYALDGCGYLLQVGNSYYKPSNEEIISDSYKASSPTPVEVKLLNYHKTVRVCMAGVEINSVKIIHLNRK